MYRFADMSVMGNPDLTTVALKIPKGVICLISALSWHEMTAEIPHEIYLALPRGAEPPRLMYPLLRIFWFQGHAFEEGVEEHDMDGIRVRICSPEKTLADCFKYRNKIGLDVVIEALKLYRQRSGVAGPLDAYCSDLQRGTGPAPYLEATLRRIHVNGALLISLDRGSAPNECLTLRLPARALLAAMVLLTRMVLVRLTHWSNDLVSESDSLTALLIKYDDRGDLLVLAQIRNGTVHPSSQGLASFPTSCQSIIEEAASASRYWLE